MKFINTEIIDNADSGDEEEISGDEKEESDEKQFLNTNKNEEHDVSCQLYKQ